MAVLRYAPGTFEEQLVQLPAALRPLSGLAHVSGLTAVFCPATEAAELSPGRLVLMLCIDCSAAQSDSSGMEPAPAASDMAPPPVSPEAVAASCGWLLQW